MPWIGIGMTLIVAGLAGGACFGLLLDVVEPIGWWRLLAVPPALLVGGFWAFVLVVGLPTTGGPEFDVATILYTLPLVMARARGRHDRAGAPRGGRSARRRRQASGRRVLRGGRLTRVEAVLRLPVLAREGQEPRPALVRRRDEREREVAISGGAPPPTHSAIRVPSQGMIATPEPQQPVA